MTPAELKRKWVNQIYPEVKGKGRNKRLAQRSSFMLGYERAILDVKAKFQLLVMEQEDERIEESDLSV